MPPEGVPLNQDAGSMRRLLRAAESRVLGYLAGLDAAPCFFPEGAAAAREVFREPLPAAPEALEEVLDQLLLGATSAGLDTASGRHLGFVPGGGLFSSAVAELIAASLNRYASSGAVSPGAAELEATSIRWMCELLRLPSSFFGVLTSGGSLSTLMALQMARQNGGEAPIDRSVVYASELVHPSFERAARLVGISPANIRKLPVDSDFRINCGALSSALRADGASGQVPLLICANAGTVSTGAIDPLDHVATLASQHRAWFHVDGAYGGAFSMLPELGGAFRGLERADSLVIDPHKGMFLPYGTGALLVKEPRQLRRTFALFPDAVDADVAAGAEGIDFFDLSPELTRPWRGLRLWLPLKLHGPDAFREALRERRQMARDLWEKLSGEVNLEMTHRPELSAFAFRLTGLGLAPAQEDAVNRRLVEWVQQSKRAFITGTTLGGRYYARICVLHLRTRRQHLDEALEVLRQGLSGARACMRAQAGVDAGAAARSGG